MADNTVLNAATTSGDTVRNIAKTGGVKTHVCVIDVGGSGTEALLGDSGVTLPVSLAFPATQAITAAALPLPAGAATETTLAAAGAILGTHTPLLGAVTETAPASDTASSGLNGRLQRIAQRLSTLIGLHPTALTGPGNLKVAVQEALPAGTNLLGSVQSNRAAGFVYFNGALVATASVPVVATASGLTLVVAGSAGQRVYVLGWGVMTDADVDVKLVSHNGTIATADLTGPLPLAANGGIGAALSDLIVYRSALGEGIRINLSANANVGGWLVYFIA